MRLWRAWATAVCTLLVCGVVVTLFSATVACRFRLEYECGGACVWKAGRCSGRDARVFTIGAAVMLLGASLGMYGIGMMIR